MRVFFNTCTNSTIGIKMYCVFLLKRSNVLLTSDGLMDVVRVLPYKTFDVS